MTTRDGRKAGTGISWPERMARPGGGDGPQQRAAILRSRLRLRQLQKDRTHRQPGRNLSMKRFEYTGIAVVLALGLATAAHAEDKKKLAFVVNGASDFWKAAEAGVKAAAAELPKYDLVLKYPEQSAAAIQIRLMDDLVAAG